MSRARLGWRGVRALIMDVDGVLTDGGLYYTEQGDELKRFDVRDGQGLVLLRQAGILTAIVTGKRTALVVRRAEELGIAEVHQGVTDKAATVTELLARHGVSVQLAKITTLGERVEDTFLISGAPLQVNKRQIEIETELLETLEGASGA